MLGGFVSGWLGLETKCCCPEFWSFARARSLSLERDVVLVLRSSRGLVARARVCVWFGPVALHSWLERVSSFFARAIVPSLERESGVRPEGLGSSLDRAFFRSSELLGCWLEQGFLGSSVVSLCLVARATKSSLERACPVYIHSSGF